jgi:hypothetical protein
MEPKQLNEEQRNEVIRQGYTTVYIQHANGNEEAVIADFRVRREKNCCGSDVLELFYNYFSPNNQGG